MFLTVESRLTLRLTESQAERDADGDRNRYNEQYDDNETYYEDFSSPFTPTTTTMNYYV